MTVKQLEERLGMTRANIRFYEREGFITPARGENNYRWYSQEDAATLEKVKLLRQLGLSLDTIRRVQRGELSLGDALAGREAELERERAGLARAEAVCRAMRQEGAEFATLDAGGYLRRLDSPGGDAFRLSLEQDTLPTMNYPWRRFFARTLDLSLYTLIWAAACLLGLRWNPGSGLWASLLHSYVALGLMLLIEPVLLATWGSTPGKWIFGLVLRRPGGAKLTWRQAARRTWGVFRRGLGWGIPIYEIVRLVKCCMACSRGEAMEWEEDPDWDMDQHYALKDERGLRCASFAAAQAAAWAVLFLVVLQAYLPIHRGASITAAQYAENVNDMNAFLGGSPGLYLDEEGHWMQDTGRDNGFVVALDGAPPDHQLTVDGSGAVTEVKLVVDRTGSEFLAAPIYQQQLAAIAFAAACGGYNCVSWTAGGVLDTIAGRPFENYTLQAGRVTITQRVEIQGYQAAGDYLFRAGDGGGDEARCRVEFTLEKTA
jgi:DNA-binding transcriptional MerR regulator/uncharacterized RDD family membrane protein YckC